MQNSSRSNYVLFVHQELRSCTCTLVISLSWPLLPDSASHGISLQPALLPFTPGLHAGNDSLMEVVREGGLTALLLDVCELALCRVSNPEPSEAPLSQEGSGLGQLQAALGALQAVLASNLASPALSLETCCDLMLLLTDVAQVCTYIILLS